MSPVGQSRPGASAQGHKDEKWPTLEHQPAGHRGMDGTRGPALHYRAAGPTVHDPSKNLTE
eukprot:6891356-Alexandrium_andersonii.AAC.1